MAQDLQYGVNQFSIMRLIVFAFLLIFISCTEAESRFANQHGAAILQRPEDSALCSSCIFNYKWMSRENYSKVNSVCSRFPVPENFKRVDTDSGSFGAWLRGLPLLPEDTKVHLYNGELKRNQSAQAAVIDIDPGKKDLQQCADAVMRLRAEYLFATAQYDQIAFNYTSGDRVDYVRWTKGRRILAQGNKTKEVWTGTKYASLADHDAFRLYMDDIFNYAGTLSLSREMHSIHVDSIRPGDVFIHGGSPGHAEIVIDVALNAKTGEKLFMLAQSYMPAQQVHILRNPKKDGIDPWYPVDFGQVLETPEYDFERGELKRF